MSLLRQVLDSEPLDDSLGAVALGDSHDVDLLVLVDDRVDGHFLFEQAGGEVHLLGHIATVDLDLQDVVLLLPEVEFVHLGGGDHSYYGGVLPDTVEFHFDGLVLLVLVFLGVLAESLLFALHPVLVEPPHSVLVQLLAPDSSECSKSSRSVNIADHSDHSHRRGFDDSHCFHHLLFVVSGTLPVHLS